jgi:hypothetical protein
MPIAHTCYSIYFERLRLGGWWFNTSQGKKFMRLYLNRKIWAWWYMPAIPAVVGRVK